MPEVTKCSIITDSVTICIISPVVGHPTSLHTRVNECLTSHYCGMPARSDVKYFFFITFIVPWHV